jgi:diguanylate cyclase (GGDEF)-like protein
MADAATSATKAGAVGAPGASSPEAELLRLVYTDDLTGLYNRRFFSKYLKQDADWSDGAPHLTLCIMDLDYLKRINDRLGHIVGDKVLKRIGAVMREQAGEGNLPVRYAGDEFAVLLPGRSREDGMEIAEKIRVAIQNDTFDEAGLPDGLHPSMSCGVASFPEDAKAGEELVDRADKALYYSKRTGKNRVTSASAVDGENEVSDLDSLAGFPSRTVVGRDDAFHAIGDAVDLVTNGRNAFFLVEGAPGVGKTRFLSELVRYSRERELTCLLEKCSPVGREQAYKSIAGLLDRYFRADKGALNVVARALDEEKRRALGDIVPAVREHETAFQAANAAAAIKASLAPAARPAEGNPRLESSGSHKLAPPKRPPGPPAPARPTGTPPVGSAPPPRPARPSGLVTTKPPPGTLATTPSGRVEAAQPPLSGEPGTPSRGAARPPGTEPVAAFGGVARPAGAGSRPATAVPGPPRPAAPRPGPAPAPVKNEPGTAGGVRPAPMRKTEPLPARPASAPLSRDQQHPTRRNLNAVAAEARALADAPLEPNQTRRGLGAAAAEAVALARTEGTAGENGATEAAPLFEGGKAPKTRSVTVFVSICEALAALSQVKPVLIIFDDIEHADEATFEIIARSLPRDGRILFCGSARTDALQSNGEDESPYAAFNASLGDFPNVFKIELAPLDREKTAELATHLLQGFRPPVALLDQLFLVSQGNPLFIEGALRYLVTQKVIAQEGETWKVLKEAPSEIPLTLEELIRGQLGVLDKETAEIIADAAVIGPNFDFEVLKNAGGKTRSEGEALDLVEAARKARLLRDTGTGGSGGSDFEFASSVVADVTYKGLDEERKKTTHKRVAELKEKGGQADAGELAYHYRRAGEKEKAERFETALRERSEQIFDRDAIEQLDDEVKQPRIPEVRDAPSAALWPLMPALAKTFVPAARLAKTPNDGSKASVEAREARDALLKALGKCFDAAPAFTLAHRGNSILLNGEHTHPQHGEGPNAEALAALLRVNSVKSITFLKSPSLDELQGEIQNVLVELGSRTVQGPFERQHWWRFVIEKDLRRINVVQKIPVLKKRRIAEKKRGLVRIAEQDLAHVREFIWNFATAIAAVHGSAPGTPAVTEAVVAVDRTLRGLLAQVPAVAINEAEGGLVVNGTPLNVAVVPKGGPELVKLLKETKLRGFCLLSDISHQELTRFVERVGRLGPKDTEGDRDPGREISADGSFPNVLVGEAMFKMAAAALGPDQKPAGEGDEAPEKAEDGEPAPTEEEKDRVDTEDAPESGLPPQFVWPTDARAKRARALADLEPAFIVAPANRRELVEVCDSLLLDGRDALARKLWERSSIAFTAPEALVRRQAAEVFQEIARSGTSELRTRFIRVAVKRLADAIEIENDVDVFEQLVRAARHAMVERIGDGDFDVASKLVFGIAKKREATAATTQAIQKIARDALMEVLRDPRAERLWDTLETGSVQDRKRAARVLEGMGPIAVGPLVEALKRTGRGRVETFLIDMLAGLIPDSEQALAKEVTPYAPAEAVKRLLRGASVVCRDPTGVLVSALQNPDPQVRVEAVSVARSVGGPVAQSVLKWAVRHGAVETQLAAVSGLGELARGDAADSVIELLDHTDTVEVQRECCLALGKLQAERAVPLLARLLRKGSLLRKEEHEDVRHAAAWALGQLRQVEEAKKALEAALEDKNKNVRLAAKAFLEGRA